MVMAALAGTKQEKQPGGLQALSSGGSCRNRLCWSLAHDSVRKINI